MKRAFLLLLPATLLVFLAIAGCDDESQPAFTRVSVYPDCGVAPLQVDGLAIASGGNETGDPTGGNNNLEITWDFGDGASSQTSLAYHTYAEAGEYTVVVTATDPDGATAVATYPVVVLADTLLVTASTNLPGNVATTADTVRFDLRASACDIDPDVEGDYVKMSYRWEIEDTTYHSRQPSHRFSAAGQYEVQVAAFYPELATVRHDTLEITVTDP